jgi:organic hydroperoxide reductase OsmC/OhrA
MSEVRTHHVTVSLDRGYEFIAEFDDIPGAPSIRFDEPVPLGANHAPNAAAVLGAAVGNCLAASLTFCLRRARIDVKDMTAHVTTHVAKNDKGRYRIHDIEVELSPVLAAGDEAKFDRCGSLFEDFCIVTASVQHGIPVHVSLKEADDKAA